MALTTERVSTAWRFGLVVPDGASLAEKCGAWKSMGTGAGGPSLPAGPPTDPKEKSWQAVSVRIAG
ncbi:hypothetical protein GCM10010519_07700 [Streptomyces lactacystinicus]